MPRRAAASGASSAAPTTHEQTQKILDQAPSKESLDAVAALYASFLGAKSSDMDTLKCLQEMDSLRFLEDALWPLADVIATVRDCRHHVKKSWVVSVLLLIGFKAREGGGLSTGVWSFLKQEDAAWKTFTTTLWTLLAEADAAMEDDAQWTLKEQTALTQFLITCFQSLEVQQVAASVLQLTSLPLWSALSSSQRALEFQTYPKLERHWNRVMAQGSEKEEKKSGKNKRRKLESATETPRHEQTALVQRLDAFFQLVKAPVDEHALKHELTQQLRFVALFLALLIDLLDQLPTRRFLLTVLKRRHVRSVLRNSPLLQHALQWQDANVRQALRKQLALLDVSMRFPIDAHTGTSHSSRESREHQARHIQVLQQCAFQSFRNSRVEELAIAPCGHIADASSFTELLKPVVLADRERLAALAVAVGVLADQAEADSTSDTELVAFFTEEYSVANEKDTLSSNASPFPTELDIWSDMLNRKDALTQKDGNATSEVAYGADDYNLFPVLPVRKLGLQFLNLADYLQRNYDLLRLDAAQDIRCDVEAAIKQLDGVRALRSSSGNETIFRGFSRAAVPLSTVFQIVKVGKPALGQTAPASVVAHLEVELSSGHDRKHFDCYQTKEVVFLVTVRATADEGAEIMGFQKKANDTGSFPENFGVQYVRAAEIIEVSDAVGNVINDETPVGKGSKRVFKLALDGTQYKSDLEAGRLEAYEQVNVLLRRKPRENNFKAVLDTVGGAWRDANKEDLLPGWLHDLFLGYGDPAAALYKSIYKSRAEKQMVVPMGELLLDGEHALEVGGADRLVNANDESQELKAKDAAAPFTYVEDLREETSVIRAYPKQKSSAAAPSENSAIRFTKAQVAAVRTGMCEGLTLVVGPPGTGKTDVAVQLVLNLYRTTPSREKILIVAHSNQALNDFFSKILEQNVIHDAEIVRMGQPQVADAGNEGAFHADFSRNGRVAFLLERRAALLVEVEQMAQWLIKRDAAQYAGLGSGSASYSCENALIFYQFHMKSFLDTAREATELSSNDEKVTSFAEFFMMRKGSAPDEIKTLREFAADIESYFAELRRLQPFELLQTPRQRGDMYLIHHARIVAMTCTHAALNHRKLTDLGLTFGSLIVEEAAQVSELDSLVPLLLACSKKTRPSSIGSITSPALKRVVLIGDAKQLPPVVKSLALKNYANFDQSLFTRLLRLGVPHVLLDQQGRSRTELADIYRWRYDDISQSGDKTVLSDLPRVESAPEYQKGNVGFAHVTQLVDLSGSSQEHQSKPFAYENEEEARFVVALVRYMLCIGYDAEQVTILTTYNAQKELLQRLLRADAPEAAKTCKVSTVDRFQGQQNDFVLLSTVRSGTTVGHLRDVRRSSTAFSRARLGLYVVGCRSTLEQARELQPFLSKLVSVAEKVDGDKATQLALVSSERVGAKAKKSKSKSKSNVLYISDRKQLDKVVADLKA